MLGNIVIIILLSFLGISSIILLFKNKKYNQTNFQLQSELNFLNKKLEDQRTIYEEISRKLDLSQKEIVFLNQEVASKNTELLFLRKQLGEAKAGVEKNKETLKLEFKNLSNHLLEEHSKKLSSHNSRQLDQVLLPLKEKIVAFEKKVEETYDKEAQQRFSLKEEVRRLAKLNLTIGKEASNLTNALRNNSKVQGNWGEMILENILEKSGLAKGREYFPQPTMKNPSGQIQRPDIIIKYPKNKHLIIDSKVSLIAYEQFISSTNDKEKSKALKNLILSLKKHIDELSSKNYSDLIENSGLDFVMMFVPIEPAYLQAINYEPNLWNYAYEKKVVLISPTNLIAALKMIANMWQLDQQNKNVLKIAQVGGALHDKFVNLLEDFSVMGKRIDAAQSSYDSITAKINTGKGSLISKVKTLQELGAKTKKQFPSSGNCLSQN